MIYPMLTIVGLGFCFLSQFRDRIMVSNATFNNNSAIPWRLILLVEETRSRAGADPGFQVKGGGRGALKKIAPSRGGHEHFGGISCVKNHDFMPKNHIFSNFKGGGGGGGACAGCAPLDPPLLEYLEKTTDLSQVTDKSLSHNVL